MVGGFSFAQECLVPIDTGNEAIRSKAMVNGWIVRPETNRNRIYDTNHNHHQKMKTQQSAPKTRVQ